MYAKVIPLFVIALINLVFAIIIFRRRHDKPSNVYYSLVVLFLATWSLGLGMFYFEPQVHNIRFWTNIVYLSGSLIPTFFLLFSLVFHRNKTISWSKLSLIFEPVVFIAYLLFFTDSLIMSIRISERAEVFGPWYIFFVVHFFVYIILTFYNLFKTRSHSYNISRTQMNYVIYGTIFTAFFGGMTNIILLVFGNYSFDHIGPYLTLMMVGLFLYAMRRYEYSWDFLARLNKASGFI
jgi:hypothetical protein